MTEFSSFYLFTRTDSDGFGSKSKPLEDILYACFKYEYDHSVARMSRCPSLPAIVLFLLVSISITVALVHKWHKGGVETYNS